MGKALLVEEQRRKREAELQSSSSVYSLIGTPSLLTAAELCMCVLMRVFSTRPLIDFNQPY